MTITRESLMTLEAYAKVRKGSTAAFIAHRRLRTVRLGENISVRRFARFKIGEPNYTVASAKVVAADEPAA